jgi:hypothetical protein
VSVGESIIQLALRKADLNPEVVMVFMLGYAMSAPLPQPLSTKQHPHTLQTPRSFVFVLLYFQCAPTHNGPHALRRGGLAAMIYTFFHCILGACTRSSAHQIIHVLYLSRFLLSEFFLLGFGVSVKILLKVVTFDTSTIPENVYIYFGSMVFGCLVAQDIIRLTHDAMKAPLPSFSASSASVRNIKRIFWILRFFIDSVVFIVVYVVQRISILSFISSLFCLCIIKYLHLPFRLRAVVALVNVLSDTDWTSFPAAFSRRLTLKSRALRLTILSQQKNAMQPKSPPPAFRVQQGHSLLPVVGSRPLYSQMPAWPKI